MHINVLIKFEMGAGGGLPLSIQLPNDDVHAACQRAIDRLKYFEPDLSRQPPGAPIPRVAQQFSETRKTLFQLPTYQPDRNIIEFTFAEYTSVYDAGAITMIILAGLTNRQVIF